MSLKQQAYYEYDAVLLAVKEAIRKNENRIAVILTWATHYGRRVGLSKEKAAEILDITPRQLLTNTLKEKNDVQNRVE